MRVAAIVVAWNSLGDLPACLASIEAQTHPDLEVIVVDNASQDGTLAWLAAAADHDRRHPLRVVSEPANVGFCRAVNDALATTDADAVMLVNPDARLAPDLLARALTALRADPRRGSVQPKVVRAVTAPDGSPVLDSAGHVLTTARLVRNRGEGERDHGQYDTAGEVFGVSGAVALHRRTMLDDVAWSGSGGRQEVLTDDLFAYFDDVELDWRARLLGWSAWYEPGATAVHERGGAGPRRTATVEALNWANRLLVIATCDDARALVRASPLVVVTTLLKTIDLVVTTPRAVGPAFGRLRLLRAARARRRDLLARAVVAPGEVVARWAEPFRWRPWLVAWWRRITGRALGVAPR